MIFANLSAAQDPLPFGLAITAASRYVTNFGLTTWRESLIEYAHRGRSALLLSFP